MGHPSELQAVETHAPDGKSEYRQYEVDFIATDGGNKYYIQSAFEISDGEKKHLELNSLLRIDDSCF